MFKKVLAFLKSLNPGLGRWVSGTTESGGPGCYIPKCSNCGHPISKYTRDPGGGPY